MVMKRFALALLLSAVGCAAQLATLPPNDNYVMVEAAPPRLTSDEQRLLDSINNELIRLGLPEASPGSYEQNAAAIMANAALAKVWRGSGRAIAEQNPNEIAPPVSNQERTNAKHEVDNGRLASLTDEEDDTEVSHLHTGQHLTANGIPQNVRVKVFSEVYAKTSPRDSDDIKTLVRSIRPHVIRGDLRIGVAILPAGDADKRIFVAAMRDRVFDLTKGPPRYGSPGMTFEVAGTVFERGLDSIKLALLGPDGKVQLGRDPGRCPGQLLHQHDHPQRARSLPVRCSARSRKSECRQRTDLRGGRSHALAGDPRSQGNAGRRHSRRGTKAR